MTKVLIKKLDSSVELPTYKTNGASGMDLMAFIDTSITLKPQKSCLIPTGISVAFPSDFEIQIRPRSGLAAKHNISVLNTPGTIDSDYRGEIKIILYNHGESDFLINNKNCDWIIANDVSNKKIGFNSDFNEVTIYYNDKKKEKLSYKKKSEISDEIVDRIINQLN